MPPKKKKYSALKQNRGYATTSVPKRASENESNIEEEPTKSPTPTNAHYATNNVATAQDDDSKYPLDETEKRENYDKADEQESIHTKLALRVRENSAKESSRILNSIEAERRISSNYELANSISLEMRDRVLSLYISERSSKLASPSSPSSIIITFSQVYDSRDKVLIKVGVIYDLLKKLGVRRDRITECLKNIKTFDVDEAINWVAIYGDEDEAAMGIIQIDEPSPLPRQITNISPSESKPFLDTDSLSKSHKEETRHKKKKNNNNNDNPNANENEESKSDPGLETIRQNILQFAEKYKKEYLQKQKISTDDNHYSDRYSRYDDDDHDDDDDDDDPTIKWATLNFSAEKIKFETSKYPGRKVGNDWSIIKNLHNQMIPYENDLIFQKDKAIAISQKMTKEFDAAILRQRSQTDENNPVNLFNLFSKTSLEESRNQSGLSKKDKSQDEIVQEKSSYTPSDTSHHSMIETEPVTDKPKESENQDENQEKESDGDDETMFGNILDEPPTEVQWDDNNTSIPVRDVSLPKGFSGKPPRVLLEDELKRIDPYSRTSYSFDKKSQCFRGTLVIRWGNSTQESFHMDEEAVLDMDEAKNYCATLALFTISKSSINRALTASFKDLWDLLEQRKQSKLDEIAKKDLMVLEDIVDNRAVFKKSTDVKKKAEDNEESIEETTNTSNPTNRSYKPAHYQHEISSRRETKFFQQMLNARMKLPIFEYRNDILSLIDQSQTLVLAGETGCGKSTQVPNFILDNELSSGRYVKILVTEPRRISATSLARRVSQELGESSNSLGTRKSLVGYTIKLESKTHADTRLTYATTGTVLRMMENDTDLNDVTHIIIDEVHERSIDSDFLLLMLKPVLQRRPDLKLILMSATANVSQLSSYMGDCSSIQVPGRTFPVDSYFLEDAIEYSQYKLDQYSTSPYIKNSIKGRRTLYQDDFLEDNDETTQETEDDISNYSSETRTTLTVLDQHQINYDLVLSLLEAICLQNPEFQEYSHAILIFVPSLEAIRSLIDILNSHPDFGSEHFKLFSLHSTVSDKNQSLVFDYLPKGVRKIVVSTNIAETGITIPDITCVIDSGKHREMRYDERRQISRLIERDISKASALQRRGRAGRVQAGLCFHLFTRSRFQQVFAENSIPEMQRLSLQDLALRIKLSKLPGSISEVFAKALDPPAPNNIRRAVQALKEVKALTPEENITSLGRHLVRMPMDVHMGKFLILSSIFSCLDAALAIAATLSSKSPFETPFGNEYQAFAARRRAFMVDGNDFLTMYKAYSGWRDACFSGNHASFCAKHFLSHTRFGLIEELREQFINYLRDVGFVHLEGKSTTDRTRKAKVRFVKVPSELDKRSNDPQIVMGCLAAAMHPKLLLVEPSGRMQTFINNSIVKQHPSSITYDQQQSSATKDIERSRFEVYYNIMESKRLYVWEIGPVEERAVLLLCGDIDYRITTPSISLDRKLKWRLAPKSIAALKILRTKLNAILQIKLKDPHSSLSEQNSKWIDLITEAFSDSDGNTDKVEDVGHTPSIGVVT